MSGPALDHGRSITTSIEELRAVRRAVCHALGNGGVFAGG